MRLPRVLYTVRGTMVAVASVAILVWIVIMIARRAEFLRRAEYHSTKLMVIDFQGSEVQPPHYELNASGTQMILITPVRDPASADPNLGAKRQRHAILRSRYEHAARQPWLPVAPDPPEPR